MHLKSKGKIVAQCLEIFQKCAWWMSASSLAFFVSFAELPEVARCLNFLGAVKYVAILYWILML